MGQFFPLPAARLMLQDLKAGRAALALVPKLELQVSLALRRIKLLELDNATLDKISERWRLVAVKHVKKLQSKDAWYNSAQFWFGVGGTVATAAVIGLVAALGHVRE